MYILYIWIHIVYFAINILQLLSLIICRRHQVTKCKLDLFILVVDILLVNNLVLIVVLHTNFLSNQNWTPLIMVLLDLFSNWLKFSYFICLREWLKSRTLAFGSKEFFWVKWAYNFCRVMSKDCNWGWMVLPIMCAQQCH